MIRVRNMGQKVSLRGEDDLLGLLLLDQVDDLGRDLAYCCEAVKMPLAVIVRLRMLFKIDMLCVTHILRQYLFHFPGLLSS